MPTVFSLLWFKPTELCKSCRKASFSSSISFDYLVSLLWQQMPLEINAFSAFNFFFNIDSKTLSTSTGNTEIWLRWDLFGCFLVGCFATKHQLDFILSHTWFCQVAKSRPEYITLDCTTRKHFWWTREKNIKLFISEGTKWRFKASSVKCSKYSESALSQEFVWNDNLNPWAETQKAIEKLLTLMNRQLHQETSLINFHLNLLKTLQKCNHKNETRQE